MGFVILFVIIDALVIFGAAMFAFWLRFSGIIPMAYGAPTVDPYALAVLVSLPVWILSLRAVGLYDRYRYRFTFEAAGKLFWAVLVAMAIVMAAGFIYRGFSYSRMVLMFWAVSAFFGLLVIHYIVPKIRKWLVRRGVGERRVIFVGLSSGAAELARRIRADDETEYLLVGYIKGNGENEVDLDIAVDLGNIGDIDAIIKNNNIDTVFFGSGLNDDQLLELIMRCDLIGVDVKIIPSTAELMVTRIVSDDTLGFPVLTLPQYRLRGFNLVVKRVFDVTSTLLGLVFLAPFLLTIALLVKLTSPGPLLYKQERLGIDGTPFTMYKFRSMRVDAEKSSGPVFAQDNDPRNTAIGALLRRYSIDEFPQLLNVLNGTMSLVGPRPERPFFVNKFREIIPRYMERHKTLSGMTGWAQVNGLRGNTSIEERVKYDLYYVENWSILFDIRIILRTLGNVLIGK